MITEVEIIHTLWDVVSRGQKNQDDPINERLMRRFLQSYRGKIVQHEYNMGVMLPDELFQVVGTIQFNQENDYLISEERLPALIRLKQGFGVMANVDDYQVSVVDYSQFLNSKKDVFNKYHPIASIMNSRMYLRKGIIPPASGYDDPSGSPLHRAINKLSVITMPGAPLKPSIFLRAILVNPDDSPGYDFTRDPYPIPNELIDTFNASILQKEFQVFLNARPDEVGNKRDNNAKFNNPEEY